VRALQSGVIATGLRLCARHERVASPGGGHTFVVAFASAMTATFASEAAKPAVVINLRLVYLARLREALGRDEERLALAGPPGDVAALLATLRTRGGAFAHELAPGRAFRVAVNHAMAHASTRLQDGDEVALLPPVTGG
jgi:molybdopterin synthase sulfur carrier subunit